MTDRAEPKRSLLQGGRGGSTRDVTDVSCATYNKRKKGS